MTKQRIYHDEQHISCASIRIAFSCSECDLTIRTGPVSVPSIGEALESVSSTRESSISLSCPECQSHFEVLILNGIEKSSVEIEGPGEISSAEVMDIFDLDGIRMANPNSSRLWQLYEDTKDNLYNVRLLLNSKEPHEHEVNQIRNKLAYSYCITCMEAFLSDALLLYIKGDAAYLRRFVEASDELKIKKISLDQYFTINILDLANETINSIIFHNLPKIKSVYQSVFQIVFPDIGEICKAVKVRHDIIHRNGKTKNGVVIKTYQKDIKDLLTKVEALIDKLFWSIRKL